MAERMTRDQIDQALSCLPDWQLSGDGTMITRRWKLKNFARAQGLANMAGWLAEDMNHHPDIAYGWGWCQISFSSHDVGGISARDIDAARRLDQILG